MSHPVLPGATERARAIRARIESVGIKLPRQRVTSDELMESCRHQPRLDLEALTGIRARRVCSEGEDSYGLAVDAALDCLEHSRHDAADLDVVISCSITKYQGGLSYRFEPALSLAIKEAIGAPQALNFDVSNACAGMLTGVAVLESMIRSGSIRRGMVVSGEYITSISDNARQSVRGILSKELASLTVGDAGAAVIVDRAPEGEEGIRACEFATLAEHSDLCIGRPSEDAPGAVMHTDARKLHKVSIDHATPIIRRALEAGDLGLGDLQHVIPHQTSVRAIRTGAALVNEQMGEPGLRGVVENLEETGNTASTSHFVALHRCLEEKRFYPSDRVLLLAFASGIVVGSLIFEVGSLGRSHGRGH